MEFITEDNFDLKELVDNSKEMCEDLYLSSPIIGECVFTGDILGCGDNQYFKFRCIYTDIFREDTEVTDRFITEAYFDEWGRYVDINNGYRVSMWQGIFPLD